MQQFEISYELQYDLKNLKIVEKYLYFFFNYFLVLSRKDLELEAVYSSPSTTMCYSG